MIILIGLMIVVGLIILVSVALSALFPEASKQIDQRIANWLRDPDHPVRH